MEEQENHQISVQNGDFFATGLHEEMLEGLSLAFFA